MRLGRDAIMGFNRRKTEDRRRQAAEKEAATRRTTAAQVFEDAERLLSAWDAVGSFSPNILGPHFVVAGSITSSP